jgi:hypothetical protein
MTQAAERLVLERGTHKIGAEPVFCTYCAPVSGAIAGAVGIIIGQPFDTLKVSHHQLQLD